MVRSLKLAVGVLALMVLALSGCRETINVGTVALPTWDSVDAFTVQVSVPGNAVSGQSGNFTVNITGGTAPFEVTYTFDDCVTPRTHTRNITGRQDLLTVTFDTVTVARTCTLNVSVTDAANRTGTRERTFTLNPGTGTDDTAPSITSATFDEATCTVTVVATDAEGDEITIDVTTTGDIQADNNSVVADASGEAVFTFAGADPLAGGTGTATFTATANGLSSAATDVDIDCAAVVLEDDTLYAIPQSTSVAVDDPVTIVVATGTPANPFHFMDFVRVIFPGASGAEYVTNSFNVGAIGGARGDVDGFWTLVDPDDFLLGSDSFITERDSNGFIALDFNITPLGGNDVTEGSGSLFNFQVTFDTPGTYQIGFEREDALPRTYYSDSNEQPKYFWGDITNFHSGIPGSITVN